tara:strand:+ start:16244 stop:17893 length:1650 start_codon:yes stop_codon:yes gene_type:complete
MLDIKFQTKDYLETLEYSNLLLYWLTCNIEDNKTLSKKIKSKLLVDIEQLNTIYNQAKSSEEPIQFLTNIKAFLLDINTVFDVSDETSNELVKILLRTLKIRFNRLSREHDYKSIFKNSKNHIDNAVYNLVDDFTDNTWELYKNIKETATNYKATIKTPAIILTYASWATQNITISLFLESVLVHSNLCNPLVATIVSFSLGFTLLANNFDLIEKNLSTFFTHAGISKGFKNFFYDPITTIKNIILATISIAAASTVLCFTGTLPTIIPYFNLILGTISSISCSIFFYQDLSHLLSYKSLKYKFNRICEILFIEPFDNNNNIVIKLANAVLNFLVTASGLALLYYTADIIFDSSKDALLNHYVINNLYNFSKYTQSIFLYGSIIGLVTISASNIYLMLKNIRIFLKDLIIHKCDNEEEALTAVELESEHLSNYRKSKCKALEKTSDCHTQEISTTILKQDIIDSNNTNKNSINYKIFGYNYNNQFTQFIANNIKPENNNGATSVSRKIISHLEPHSGVMFIDMAKMLIAAIFETGAVEHDLFSKLKFRN